jgi:hypothetical protein
MTPELRSELEIHLRAIHEILCRENVVKVKHGWAIEGTLADGRHVKHQLSISGFEIPRDKLPIEFSK